MEGHLHHGIHWGLHWWTTGHHACRARHRVNDGCHIILLLLGSVLLYKFSMLLLLLADLKKKSFFLLYILWPFLVLRCEQLVALTNQRR